MGSALRCEGVPMKPGDMVHLVDFSTPKWTGVIIGEDGSGWVEVLWSDARRSWILGSKLEVLQ